MKKTYISPATDVVTIQPTALLAGSGSFGMNDNKASANNALSDDWDDELAY